MHFVFLLIWFLVPVKTSFLDVTRGLTTLYAAHKSKLWLRSVKIIDFSYLEFWTEGPTEGFFEELSLARAGGRFGFRLRLFH